MIHILFVPGSFGSMLEWGIRSYSHEYPDPQMGVTSDGAMHRHYKLYHPTTYQELIKVGDPTCITTAIHPMIDYSSQQIIEFFNRDDFKFDKKILIDIPDIETAELVILMQYYKILIGLDKTLDIIFYNDESKYNITRWNEKYKHWSDMELWELREWFSLYYSPWVNEWVTAKDYITTDWKILSPLDLVTNYKNVIKNIIEFCDLTYCENTSADVIVKEWVTKQHSIINEKQLINQIVEATLNRVPLEWGRLSVLHEAMIQKKLRDHGYELKCYKLNQFPNNTVKLNELIEQ